MQVSTEDNAAPDLDQYRSYLKLLADLQLNPRLKVKEAPSDIVQQTMLEAHRDFAGFRGRTEAELRAWLKMMKQERSEQLAEALLKLLDDERSAVVLKHFHSWSVAEIAQHLGRTQEAVAGLLRRGLKKLRDHLSEVG